MTADDGKVMRVVISRKLEEKGRTVSAVEGGRQALELIDREPFDLVILDIDMPEMNGIETHLKLKRATEELARRAGSVSNPLLE